jgi:hypothetical protein
MPVDEYALDEYASLPKHVAVKLLISILEENCLATISALGHVVRKTRDDHSGEPTMQAKYH